MERPTVTPELIAEAARRLAKRQGWSSDGQEVDELARVYRGRMDGYSLAKALDSACGWSARNL